MTDPNYIPFWQAWLRDHGHVAAARRVDATIEGYIADGLSSTMRNRLRYAAKIGYTSRVVTAEEFNARHDEVWAIRCSTPERQGYPMRPAYLDPPRPMEAQPYETIYGSFTPDDVLIAYIVGHYNSWLACASSIIGHVDYIGKIGSMVQVWTAFMRDVIARRMEWVVYSKWTDGLEGLRQWKRAVGLECTNLSKEEL